MRTKHVCVLIHIRTKGEVCFVCFDSKRPSTNQRIKFLAQVQKAVPVVSLEPATPWYRVEHSTIELPWLVQSNMFKPSCYFCRPFQGGASFVNLFLVLQVLFVFSFLSCYFLQPCFSMLGKG